MSVGQDARATRSSIPAFPSPTVILRHSDMPKVALPYDWSYNGRDMTSDKSDMAAVLAVEAGQLLGFFAPAWDRNHHTAVAC